MALRVLHLAGSPTSDFYADLSRLYAQDCLTAVADPDRYEPHVAYVTPDGRWRFPADLTDAAIATATPIPLADAITRITALGIDAAVPQMFCRSGMTSYRALLDVLRIPYVGNTAAVMAMGADKATAKAVVAAAGVAVPAGELLRPGHRPTVRPPAVVKPVDADNSLGTSFVSRDADWDGALAAAFEHGDTALVESYVELGREVRCGIVVDGGRRLPLPLEEYRVRGPIRTHDDKIVRRDDGDLHLVAKDVTRAWIVDPTDPLTERVWEAALACHEALGCRHYSLFDFRVDPSGRPWFLEASLYCSFARTSVLAVMAAAAEIPLDVLFARALDQAMTS